MDPGYVAKESVRRLLIDVEPLFPIIGTAAFLFASRIRHASGARLVTSVSQATSKEPIET
ncbi:hypothetical protein AWB81_01715 [Caballeronia arationis]|jgi:hypothetical protein|uniref:Uncharacterized protein n=1 Tax=Caballeronia arationis TaxID=1777142 RepID=A0A7Z7N544_9BURK|nr:hypothetical protein [Caballeronia arationis]SAK58326.1 hypothetical protein AWB81_01715 [Caballeronia arationis]SOE81777.1 hypothetical protein SAMN05446927_5073 [Caballeronia arationis]